MSGQNIKSTISQPSLFGNQSYDQINESKTGAAKKYSSVQKTGNLFEAGQVRGLIQALWITSCSFAN
jgi:hypothetical protein